MTPDQLSDRLDAIPRIVDALEGPEVEHIDGTITHDQSKGLIGRTIRLEEGMVSLNGKVGLLDGKVDDIKVLVNGKSRLEPKERVALYVAGIGALGMFGTAGIAGLVALFG